MNLFPWRPKKSSKVKAKRGLQRLLALLLPLALSPGALAHPNAAPAPLEPSGVVTLRDALAAAVARSPSLGAFSAELRAREALTLQAGLPPNPEFRTAVENVGGSGNRQGFQTTETTLLLSTVIELGGKRAKRERLAALGQELAGFDYEAKRLEVLSRTTKVFIRVLAAQERITMAARLERVATAGMDAVSRSVSAGAAPALETSRARITLGRAQMALALAKTELETARAQLAASWGAEQADFAKVVGELAQLPEPLPEARLLDALRDAPQLVRWRSERRAGEAALALEASRAIPDVAVGAGGRHFSDNKDNALVFELSIPLPVFDRNQGAIAAAQAGVDKTTHEAAASEIALYAAVHEANQRLRAAHEQATSLRTNLLPAARTGHVNTVDAFKRGLLRPLDLIESERTLVELEGEYLIALEAGHLAAADLEQLAGLSLPELSRGERRR